MKSVYVENYMNLSDNEKKSFLSFMDSLKDIKVSSTEMVFSESSLIINLIDKYEANKIYTQFKDFFHEMKNVKVELVKKLLSKDNQTILSFSKKQIRV